MSLSESEAGDAEVGRAWALLRLICGHICLHASMAGMRLATPLLAMLSSLQMGFRTLALEKRSSEVWQVLGAVKTEFGKFGDVLSKVKSQTQTVLNTLDGAEVRSRAMGRALKKVESLPEHQAAALIPQDKDFDSDASLPLV